MKPWEHLTYTEEYFSKKYNTRFKRTFETVHDSKQLHLRKGDIVKFASSFYFNEKEWRRWFVKEEDLKQICIHNKSVPYYANEKLALVINRYRWIKYKHGLSFIDYGASVMILEGSKKGHIKKISGNLSSIELYSRFPNYQNSTLDLEEINKLFTTYPDTEEVRDLYIEKIFNCLNKGE